MTSWVPSSLRSGSSRSSKSLPNSQSISRSINSTGMLDIELDGQRVNEILELLSDYKNRRIYAVYLLARPGDHSMLGPYDHWIFKCVAQNLLIHLEFGVDDNNKVATFNEDICQAPTLSNLWSFFYDTKTGDKFKRILAIEPKFSEKCIQKFWKYRKNLREELKKDYIAPFIIQFLEESKHKKYFTEMIQIKSDINVGQIKKIIDEWRQFNDCYNILNNNCQSFVFTLLNELLSQEYPKIIEEVAKLLKSHKNRVEEMKRINERKKTGEKLNQIMNDNSNIQRFSSNGRLSSHDSDNSSVTTISVCTNDTSGTGRTDSTFDENGMISCNNSNSSVSSKSPRRKKKIIRKIRVKRKIVIKKKKNSPSNPSNNNNNNNNNNNSNVKE